DAARVDRRRGLGTACATRASDAEHRRGRAAHRRGRRGLMLETWLQLGDRGLAFEAPHLLVLAWAAPSFLLLAIVTQLRRRAAKRAGWPVPPAWRLWLATLLRTGAYLGAVA